MASTTASTTATTVGSDDHAGEEGPKVDIVTETPRVEDGRNSATPQTKWSFWQLVDPHLQDFDEEMFATSVHVTPQRLILIRMLMAFYCICVIPIDLFNPYAVPVTNAKIFYLTYFTNLTYIGLLIYLLTASYNTWIFIKDGYSARRLHERPAWLRWINWNLYACAAVFHWIVPFVFWTVLSEPMFNHPRAYDVFCNVSVHGITFVFIMIEFFMGRVPLFFSQWTGFVFIAALYMCATQVFHATLSYLVADIPED